MINDLMFQMPLVAILRGISPSEVVPVGEQLWDAGFRVIEIPLNSPQPLESIGKLAHTLQDRCLIGAGTVLSPREVDMVAEAGGRLVISPNFDPAVVGRTKDSGLFSMPGVATPTEAFGARLAGADALKLFPAEAMGPAVVKAWRAVLPKPLMLVPTGGITPPSMAAYLAAGASGFGLGSALYAPGMPPTEVRGRADAFVKAWSDLAQYP